MTNQIFRSLFWTTLRVSALLMIGLFLWARIPSRGGLTRLTQHGVMLELNEDGHVLGVELTQANLHSEILTDLSELRHAKSIRLQSLAVDDALIAAIQGMPELRKLAFRGCTLTDDQLQQLRGHQFQTLDLSGTSGLNRGFAVLDHQRELREINLRDCQWVTDDHVRILAEYPSLQSIDLSNTPITDAGIASLSVAGSMRYLSLSDCPSITHESLASLKKCPLLRVLDFRRAPLLLSAVAEFQRANPLCRLEYDEWWSPDISELLTNCDPTRTSDLPRGDHDRSGLVQGLALQSQKRQDVSVLRSLKDLRSLRLTGAGFDGSILPVITELKSLESLALIDTSIADSDFENLPGPRNLLSVSLSGQLTGDATLRYLTRNSKLRYLNLSGTKFPPQLSSNPLEFQHLVTLGLNETNAREQVLRKIHAPGLQSLYLRSCQLSSGDLGGVAGFTGLQTLDLSDNPGIEHGLESLPRQIRTLHLAGTSLTDDGLRGLSQMTDLHSLVLSSTRISGAGLDALADLPLQWIGLNRVSFSKDGFDALCRIKKLRKIDISHSSVPEDAWHSLLNCPALRDLNAGAHTAAIQVLLSSSVGSRLESVTLSVADEETLRSLHRFPQLKKLILDSCEIDEDTALILAGSTNCDSLQLKTCSVSVETIHVLEESGFVNDTGLHYLQTEDFREQVFSSMRTPTPRTLHFVRMQQ